MIKIIELYVCILVRFLALVTTLVTKVDHGNHRSNDCVNHCNNHHGSIVFLIFVELLKIPEIDGN